MKTVSIIIVNHNGRRFLKRLFETIHAQTFQGFEVIFVDNGSKDDSVEYAANNFPDVKIIRSGNLGYGAGCNEGAKKAEGRYLIFLNEDMYLPKDFLKKIIEFHEGLPDQKRVGAISCKMVDFDADPNDCPPTFGAKIDAFGFPVKAQSPRETFIVSGSPMFIRKDLFLSIRGFNEAIFVYGEDVDISWRLNIMGYNNFMSNSTYLHHYGGGATGSLGPKKTADIAYGAFISILSNYSWAVLFFILPIFFLVAVCFFSVLSIAKFKVSYIREAVKKADFFRKNIRKAFAMRHFVQMNRKRNGLYLMKYISLVPAFIANSSLEKLRKGHIVKNY